MLYTEKELIRFKKFEGTVTEFNNVLQSEKGDYLTIICEVVSGYFNEPIEIVNEKNRNEKVVNVRQIAHYFAYYFTNYSLPKIAYFIGKKNHATVWHSAKTICNYIDTDPLTRQQISDIEILLKKRGLIQINPKNKKRLKNNQL